MAATADLVQGVAELVKSAASPPPTSTSATPTTSARASRACGCSRSLYFRGEVRGLGNVPEEGPVLLVGNHSGGNLTPDTSVFTLAFSTYFGVERAFYQLAHNLVLSMPGLSFLRKYGTVAASHENARKALRGRRRGARLPRRRLRGPPPELGAQPRRLRRPQGLHPARARARACRSSRSSRSAARRPRCSSRAASGSPRACGSTSCSA